MLDQITTTATAVKPIMEFIAGLGLVTVFGAVLLAVLNRNAQLRQWRNFKGDLESWAAALISVQGRHPNELSDDDWRAECETMLYDAQFTPTEISQIIDLAIIVAKSATIDAIDTRRR